MAGSSHAEYATDEKQ